MEAIVTELRQILREQPGLRPYNFSVKAIPEGILVTGLVDCYYHWQIVQEASIRHLSPKGIKYNGKISVKGA